MTTVEPVRPSLHVAEDSLPKQRRRDDDEGEDDWVSDYTPMAWDDIPEGAEDEKSGEIDELFADDEEQKLEKTTQNVPTDPWICVPCDDSRIPRTITSPIRPSAETIEQHFIAGHVNYRNWCPVCVMARGREDAHPRRKEEDEDDRTGLPIISMDYNELNEESANPQKVIIGKDEVTGNVFAHNVIAKGLVDDWICKKLVQDFEEFGRSDIILKTDGEPAIKAVQNRVQALRHGRTVPRNPPAYNPQANGPCEKAVQDVTALLRSIKIALEYRMKVKIHDDAPIMQWALEHAVFLLNKLNVHKEDGMTSYERLTGRKWRRQLVEFGELVLAKLALRRREKGKAKKQKRKLAHRCVQAVWVGQVARTGEHIVILDSGDAVRCRTIKRVPVESRWDPERALLVKATPRCPAPSSKNPERIESRVTDDVDAKVEDAKQDGQREKPDVDLPGPEPREGNHGYRDFRITKQLLEKYGYTDGCTGCVHKACGLDDHRPHDPQCRQRLSEAMMSDEREREQVAAAKRRKGAQPQQNNGGNVEERESKYEVTENKEPNEDSADADVDADVMSIPELDSDVDMGDAKDDDPFATAKEAFDEDLEDETVERGSNRESSQSRRGSNRESSQSRLEPDSKRPRIANVYNLQTLVGRDLAGIVDDQREELIQCINNVQQLKSKGIVSEVLEKLQKSQNFKATRARDVRRAVLQDRTGTDVAEMYSPPRITKMAHKLGLRDGWALDLTEVDPDDGKAWDFNDESKRNKAKKMLKTDKPMMLIMSPMCGPFSKLQELFNYPHQDRSEVEEKIKEALIHLRFTVELCLMQHEAGRLFLFEHPASASSWSSEVIQYLTDVRGVHHVKFDFCMLGMVAKDGRGNEVPAKKRTGVLTNSDAVAALLRSAQCRGEHWHLELVNGRAGPCQVYPDKFSRLICEGIKRELDTIRWRNEMNQVFDITSEFGKIMALQEKVESLATPPEEDPFTSIYNGFEFHDDLHDRPLNRELAIKARKTEIQYFKDMGVYTKVKRQSWMRVITTKWIDTNKGDEADPNYRARLVGRELNLGKREGLFAATPPVESLRMILSICASNQHSYDSAKNFVVMSNDIKRAYFYAPVSRPMFIIIPEEDHEDGDEDMVGQLNLSLYGTRDAAVNWAHTFTAHLKQIGFAVGDASPCNFYHAEKEISLTVHGDDFTSTGREGSLRWLDAQLKSKYEVKTDILGPNPEHSQQLRILNRVISWDETGITYEADQRHAEIIIKAMEVQKAVATPGSRDDAAKADRPNVTGQTYGDSERAKTLVLQRAPSAELTSGTEVKGFMDVNGDELHPIHAEALKAEAPLQLNFEGDEEQSPLLDKADSSVYRALAARANYLAQDRPDVQFAVKEVARRMATPRVNDWLLLKRLARYLVGAPRGLLRFVWQSQPAGVDTYVDADWAGCKRSCRSTSGGALMHGWHCIKSWSSTQATVALSSGESELYSLTKGASQTLGMMALAADLGIKLNGTMHTDASATLGIVQRQGLGKLRHIGVQYLWLQERVRDGSMSVKKVLGHDNPADLMTKHLAAQDIDRHAESLSLERYLDRASTAPMLSAITRSANGKVDSWNEDELTVTRTHAKPRQCRFTPLRVAGAPPVRALTGTRVTRGVFTDNGELFTVVDNWTTRSTAHASTSRPWVGSTQFWKRSDWKA